MSFNTYTKDVMINCSNWYQKQLERVDLFDDERKFYTDCLIDTLQHIDFMIKNGVNSINLEQKQSI